MEIFELRAGDRLTLQLKGRLDMAAAPLLDKALQLEGIKQLILDFDGCSFISSAGLREILRGYKAAVKQGGTCEVVNVSREVKEVFDLSGLSEMMTVRKKAREISIEGLEFINAGKCGECYRLDEETVVKLYHEGVTNEITEQEKEVARAAFVLGLPTAISYEVVTCGARTGVVYEMLDATLFSTVVINDLDNMDKHARLLAGIAQKIHGTKANSPIFPDIKNTIRQYLPQMDFFLSAEEIALLQRKLETIPDSDTCVHFDLHTSNIMVKDDEPIIIDMGDFSRGSHLFDLGQIHTVYGYPEINICSWATKIPDDKGAELMELTFNHYFADKPAAEFEFFNQNRDFLSALRICCGIATFPSLRDVACPMVKNHVLPRMMAADAASGV